MEEMLLYTAELKRPLGESTASKREAVDMLIEDLNLGACRRTRIGNSLHRGISGGQARLRTSLRTFLRMLVADHPSRQPHPAILLGCLPMGSAGNDMH